MSSPAEIIKTHVKENLKKNFDYSTSRARGDDFRNLVKSNTKILEKHRSLYYTLFPRILEEQGLDPASYGMKRKDSIKKSTSDDMSSTITPKPKGAQKSEQQETKTEEQKKEEQKKLTESESVEINLAMAKVTVKTAYSLVKARFHWEGLSQEEEETLGTVWLPILREYLQNYLLKWGLPIAVTAGILIDKNNRFQESQKREKKNQSPPDNTTQETRTPAPPPRQESNEKTSGWLSEVGAKTD